MDDDSTFWLSTCSVLGPVLSVMNKTVLLASKSWEYADRAMVGV